MISGCVGERMGLVRVMEIVHSAALSPLESTIFYVSLTGGGGGGMDNVKTLPINSNF